MSNEQLIDDYVRPFYQALVDRDAIIDEQTTRIQNLEYADQIKTDDQQRLLNQLARCRADLAMALNERDNLRATVSKLEAAMIPLNAVFARRQSRPEDYAPKPKQQRPTATAREALQTSGI